MPDNWAGVAIIVAVQLVTFFFTKRAFDRLDKSISRLEKTLAETRVELEAFKEDLVRELTGQMEAMKTELSGQITAMNTELSEQMEAMNTELSEQIAAMNTELSEQIAVMNTELSEQIATMKIEPSPPHCATNLQTDSRAEE